MKQKKVFLLCGPSGAGKSTWVQTENYAWGTPGVHCSRDKVRFSLVSENEDYFSKEDLVFDTWIAQIQKALDNVDGPNRVYIDATHLTEKARNKVLRRLNNLNQHQVIAVNFFTSLELCLYQNNMRSGREKVPETVIKNMFNSFRPAGPGEFYQYDKIVNIMTNEKWVGEKNG